MQILRKTGFGRLRRTDEDTLQRGGDFVIAPDGTLAYGFWVKDPMTDQAVTNSSRPSPGSGREHLRPQRAQ